MTDQIVGKVMLVHALLVRNLTPIGQVVFEYAQLIWETISDCLQWLMDAIPKWYEDGISSFNAWVWINGQILRFYSVLWKPIQYELEKIIYPNIDKFKAKAEEIRLFQKEKILALWSLKDTVFEFKNGQQITLEQFAALVIILAAQVILLEKCYGAVSKLFVSVFKEDEQIWQRIKWYLVFASIVMFIFGSQM